MIDEAKHTFWDLIIGIGIYTVVIGIPGTVISADRAAFLAGLLYGALLSAGLALHMYRSLDKTLDFEPSEAEKRGRAMAMARMGIMAVAVGAAILLSSVLSMVGVILGMMALKLSAYLQPFIRNYITTKIYGKGR